MYTIVSVVFTALSLASAQQVGTNTAESHPALSVQSCTKSGGCTTQAKSIVLDANWRWLHSTNSLTNCYSGQSWDATLCPDPTICAKNCAVEGADYSGTYGISTAGNSLSLGFVTRGSNGNSNIGSRVYLLDDTTNYKIFNLLNAEFTFDVDVSRLPCGLNGALYFSQMDQDGGMKRFSATNKAGAKYGTGYCDAQCPRDLKFVNGVANINGWSGSPTDPNSGKGNTGSCCSEMDIWEANSISTAYTPHPCSATEQTACTGDQCSNTCDQPGCDFNSWRMGNRTFYGPGSSFTIDTTKKITVVTQFITDDNTNQGNLIDIKRFYVQNGKTFANSNADISGVPATNSITDNLCAAQKMAFKDNNDFAKFGGLKKMGEAFKSGMVLTMSVWDDHAANLLWLDSNYPLGQEPSQPGVGRGSCPTTSGLPADLEKNSPNAKVAFSNIKWGDLNSTFDNSPNQGGGGSPPPLPPASSSTRDPVTSTSTAGAEPSAPPAGNCAAKWGQCGGQGWTGATCCAAGFTCQVGNPWYSQCL